MALIDASEALTNYLLSKSSLTTLTGDRIWGERNNPLGGSNGYKPSHGVGIAFRSRFERFDYSRGMLLASWQFKVYGIDEAIANAGFRALVGVLDDSNFTGWPGVKAALLENKAGTLRDPSTDWIYVLCFFETWMQAELA